MQTILLLIGESGSGKSTFARQYILDHPDFIRVNRDELRIELAAMPNAPRGRKFEDFVAATERNRSISALKSGKSVLVDNTHLNSNTVNKWQNLSVDGIEFQIQLHRMTTSLEDCIQNDLKRKGTNGYVGRAVVERQFLLSGRLLLDLSKKIVLVDVDGTLANSDGIRGPFEENRVDEDQVYPVIADWVRNLYLDHTVCIVSGRHSTCGPKTVEWLQKNNIPFHHIFMRHGWDSRKDYIVKSEILNELLQLVPKEQIKMVLDDRPQVIQQCWKANGVFCIPVRGVTKHSENCSYYDMHQKYTCPMCGAIGDF